MHQGFKSMNLYLDYDLILFQQFRFNSSRNDWLENECVCASCVVVKDKSETTVSLVSAGVALYEPAVIKHSFL